MSDPVNAALVDPVIKKWFRRIRGVGGVGGGGAVVGGCVGRLVGRGSGWPARISGPFWVLGAFRQFAQLGLISGGAFSVVLGLAEGRRTFDEMSLVRLAVWGTLASLLMVVTITVTVGLGEVLFTRAALIRTALIALLGAGSAAGSLALPEWQTTESCSMPVQMSPISG